MDKQLREVLVSTQHKHLLCGSKSLYKIGNKVIGFTALNCQISIRHMYSNLIPNLIHYLIETSPLSLVLFAVLSALSLVMGKELPPPRRA
jgi:hypothetical protein